MVTIEDLREKGLMDEDLLCLGGGHGVRAYLPVDLQRFSIDLDFYSNCEDIHDIKNKLSKISGFKSVGYGEQAEGRFKMYDSAPPKSLKKCTIALTKHYKHHFSYFDVQPEFYVTVSNTMLVGRKELRKPKSYIKIQYVKEAVPVLSPGTIITSKILALPTRKLKDFYKDIFDIYALFKWGEVSVDEKEIDQRLSKSGYKIERTEVFTKFKLSSDQANARNAIKLPTVSRSKYLNDWASINEFVKSKVMERLERSRILPTYT
jgi:predicted nucleotidyltransferase component of viral defense system